MKFICVCAPQCPSLSPLMIFALKSLFCKSDNITSNVVFHHFRLVLGASGIRHTQAHKRCTCLVNSTRATCTFLLEGAAFLHTLFRIVCKTPFNAVRCLKPHESGARGAGHSERGSLGAAGHRHGSSGPAALFLSIGAIGGCPVHWPNLGGAGPENIATYTYFLVISLCPRIPHKSCGGDRPYIWVCTNDNLLQRQ